MAGLLLGVKSSGISLSSGATLYLGQIAPSTGSNSGAKRLVHSHLEIWFKGAAATDQLIRAEMVRSTSAGTWTSLTGAIKAQHAADTITFGSTAAENASVAPTGLTETGLGGGWLPTSGRPLLIGSGEFLQVDAGEQLNIRLVAGTLAAPVTAYFWWRWWE